MAEFHSFTEDSVQILEIAGRIEPDSWKAMKEALDAAASKQPDGKLLVDLEKLEYIASSGFRDLFLAGRKLSREGGSLAVCSAQGEVKRVFQLAGFATVYPIFETRAAGLEHFKTA